MKTGDYAAIVLAAGFSSRMDGFKATLPLGGVTLTEHVISTFLQNDVEVYLVVGYRQDEVRAAIRKLKINVVENPDYRYGMFTSVQAGARKLRADHRGFFVLPVDIPLVMPATIARLMNEAEKHPDSIIYPVFNGRRGHPPLIPSALIPTIVGWNKDGGLKAVLSTYEESVLNVVVTDSNILFDIDTPGDYKELLDRFQRLQ
jgi:molybdenum cofactor cytidylyltransferase